MRPRDWHDAPGATTNGAPAVFVKQLGAKPVETHPYINGVATAYSYLALSDRKGGDWDEWPDDLRIREFPTNAMALA